MSKKNKNQIVLDQKKVMGTEFNILPLPFKVDNFTGNASERTVLLSYTLPINKDLSYFAACDVAAEHKKIFDHAWDYDNKTVTIFFAMDKISSVESHILNLISIGVDVEHNDLVEDQEMNDAIQDQYSQAGKVED